MWPKVSVIVLNWNGKDNTRECLESLRHVDYPNYDLIVVDNGSSDGSQIFLKENFHEITLIENERNLGFPEGFNVGIRAAIRKGADYILCLNNDTVVDKRILRELIKVGEKYEQIGGLGPKEYEYYRPDRIVYAGGTIRFVKSAVYGCGEKDAWQYEKVKETRMLCGSAMMLKTKALVDIGLFDPIYFFGFEDQDLAFRLINKGYRIVFVPKAKLWHKRRGSTGGKITPLTAYFKSRNYLIFVKKHATTVQLILFVLFFALIYFPLSFIQFLLSGNIHCVGPFVKGLLWHINGDQTSMLSDQGISNDSSRIKIE